jgi:3-hydroxyisobutyrate dehydrogenase
VKHGARLVSRLSEVVRDEAGRPLDGAFVCCGKNGEDAPIIGELAAHLRADNGAPAPFLVHLSTVSNRFVHAAARYCHALGVRYVNWPLTGGPAGAEKGTMLILAGGDRRVFDALEPALRLLGRPSFFGERADAGADVKFIGHLMVFNGLLGITSALALHSMCFRDGIVGGPEQTAFFDLLNQGAGGTRQWDVIAINGIRDGVWDAPFLARYALVDAVYVAELCQDRGLAPLVTQTLFQVIHAFQTVLERHGDGIATHAVVRELVGGARAWAPGFAPGARVEEVVARLSPSLQRSVELGVSEQTFSRR